MNTESAWKSAEHLVSFLEKVIDPDARIEHDVHLPVLGQQRTRQCDVVIWIGRPPRELVFIVEVQSRDRKPELNTFHGWVAKMQEVGANGLICVSSVGFPSSIVGDVATRQGGKVKLMTLRPSDDPSQAWATLHLSTEVVECTFEKEILTAKCPVLWEPFNGDLRVQLDQPVLSSTGLPEDAEHISDALNGLLKNATLHSLFELEPSCSTMELKINLTGEGGSPLWLHTGEGLVKIKSWELDVLVTRIDQLIDAPFAKWTYTQQDHDGVVAWAASAETEIRGKPVTIEMGFKPQADGSVQPSFNVRGEAGGVFSASIEKFGAGVLSTVPPATPHGE